MAASSLDTVSKALLELEGYPYASRQMMVDGLPLALRGGAGRDYCQAQFIALVRDALRDAQSAALEEKAAHERSIGEERAAAEANEALLGKAASAAEERARVLAEKEELCRQAEQRLDQAQRDYEQMEGSAGRRQSLEHLEHSLWEQREVRSLLDRVAALEEGRWDEDAIGQVLAVEAVVGRLADIVGAGEALAAAARPALRAKREERVQWDNVVLEHVRRALQARSLSVDQQVSAARTGKDHVDAEHLGLWALADVARDQAAFAADACSRARAAVEAANSARDEAEKRTEAQKLRVKEALEASGLASERARLAEGALAALETLTVGSSQDVEMCELGAAEVVEPRGAAVGSSRGVAGAEEWYIGAAGDEAAMVVPKGTDDRRASVRNSLGIPTPMMS
ncbi:unnamed protein product [Prorocentrum cordatum]|uniref:Uncharacterized protein n=2 Tax=Prorocentrum cordatum TaxID=2364126 RepID=A0ABN9PH88_9DINO|nr:unnamed protein product [Polarella glacialis]